MPGAGTAEQKQNSSYITGAIEAWAGQSNSTGKTTSFVFARGITLRWNQTLRPQPRPESAVTS